jgi:hypothetical protein
MKFPRIYCFKGYSIIIKRKKKSHAIFPNFRPFPNNTIEKNITVFIDDDIGQLKSMNSTHIYIYSLSKVHIV